MKFTIDYSKWRCGGETNPYNRLGHGGTELLNAEGFMCCIGQCSLQTIFTKEEILYHCSPNALKRADGILNIENKFILTNIDNTELTNIAMGINDDLHTKPKEKIVLLIPLFQSNGHELEFINVPN